MSSFSDLMTRVFSSKVSQAGLSVVVAVLITLPLTFPGRGWSQNTNGTTIHPNYYQMGVLSYKDGELEQSLHYMKKAMVEDPVNPNIRYYAAICLDQLHRGQEAQLQYQYVVDKSTDTRLTGYAQERLNALKTEVAQSLPAQMVSVATAKIKPLTVPLKEAKNALMVDVTLRNVKTGKSVTGTFILDTGATYTSISQEMADALGVDQNTGDSVRITTANGKIDVPKVTLDSVSVNGLEAHAVPATVIQVKNGSSFQGLLGLSFIRQFKMTIDPEANQLVFEPN